MKVCNKCGPDLQPLTNFNKRYDSRDGYASICRTHARENVRVWYVANKDSEKIRLKNKKVSHRLECAELINKAKDVPCMDCGGNFPIICMDFDHLGDKIFTISDHARGRYTSIETLLAEIAKCDVVCSNCHRIRTFNRVSL